MEAAGGKEVSGVDHGEGASGGGAVDGDAAGEQGGDGRVVSEGLRGGLRIADVIDAGFAAEVDALVPEGGAEIEDVEDAEPVALGRVANGLVEFVGRKS